MSVLVDRLIPYYVWFIFGFGVLSILLGIANFGMLLITTITVKGIYISLWLLPIVGILFILACISIGYVFEKYKLWSKITSHQTRNTNPEVDQLCKDVQAIKAMLEGMK